MKKYLLLILLFGFSVSECLSTAQLQLLGLSPIQDEESKTENQKICQKFWEKSGKCATTASVEYLISKSNEKSREKVFRQIQAIENALKNQENNGEAIQIGSDEFIQAQTMEGRRLLTVGFNAAAAFEEANKKQIELEKAQIEYMKKLNSVIHAGSPVDSNLSFKPKVVSGNRLLQAVESHDSETNNETLESLAQKIENLGQEIASEYLVSSSSATVDYINSENLLKKFDFERYLRTQFEINTGLYCLLSSKDASLYVDVDGDDLKEIKLFRESSAQSAQIATDIIIAECSTKKTVEASSSESASICSKINDLLDCSFDISKCENPIVSSIFDYLFEQFLVKKEKIDLLSSSISKQENLIFSFSEKGADVLTIGKEESKPIASPISVSEAHIAENGIQSFVFSILTIAISLIL